MKTYNITVIYLLTFVILLSAVSSHAETRFVSGYRDGIWVYAVIERNGMQVRTDRMGDLWNQHVWDELSSADRMKLIKTYSWMTYRLKADFSTRFTDINTFYNDESGWTAVVQALKDKHAMKDFPILASFYDNPSGLVIPGVNGVCWEVRISAGYIKARKLRKEIETDYAVGKDIYEMLINANWDQIAISIKALSPAVIEMITSNFITPFVTNGASAVSGLVATSYGFAKNLDSFINAKYSSGQPPPSPTRLIEKLDDYIANIEGAANDSISVITAKQTELQSLVNSIQDSDEACVLSKQQAAEQIRESLLLSIETKPAAEILNIVADPVPDPLPEGYNYAYEWVYDNIRSKVMPLWIQVSADAATVAEELEDATAIVNDRLNTTQIEAQFLEPDLSDLEDEAIPGFDGKYRYLHTMIDEPDQWTQKAQSSLAGYPDIQEDYEQIGSDAQAIITDYLPRMNPVDARALGLNPYADYLGPVLGTPLTPPPSARIDEFNLRPTLAAVPEILATPEQALTETIADFDNRGALLQTAISNIPAGVTLREEWMFEQNNKYNSLVFNFENSLSYVIATLTQIDQLHVDPYLKRAATPFITYDGHSLYRYSVDVSHIQDEINTAIASGIMAPVARKNAMIKLYELYDLHQSLIQKLIIAQATHLNDAKVLNDFFTALYAHYDFGFQSRIFADIASVTGIMMLGTYDLFTNLTPNITFYYLGIDNWIRNEDNLELDMSEVQHISGLSVDYYSMLTLYQYMKAEKSHILAMTTAEFDDFMSQTTISHDLYKSRLTGDGLFTPDWPAWQLSFATSNRQSLLNDLYRYGTVSDPYYYQVSGTISTPEGQGISGIDLVLDGHYGADGSGAHVTFTTTSTADGYFAFSVVSTGIFEIQTIGAGVEYISTPESTPVTLINADISVIHTVIPTEESGYILSGRVVSEQGQGISGTTVNVVSEASGEVRTVLTSESGQYVMAGLTAGVWDVYPAEQEMESAPLRYTKTIGPGEAGLDFVLGPPKDVFADVNDDNITDLKDLILTLKVLSGQSADISNTTGDVNDDSRIGIEEAQAVLQVLSQ